MAQDKKSILVYADWISIFKKLEDDEAGKLIKHFFEYVNDLNPEPPNRLTELLFEPIKITLKRDLKKWETEIDKQSKAGRLGNLKRYNIDLYNKVVIKELTLEEAENISISRKVSPPDQVPTKDVALIADSVNDNVSDNDIKSKPKKTDLPQNYAFIDSLINQFKESYEEFHESTYEIISIGKERKLVASVLKQFKIKRPGLSSDQTLKELRAYFDLCNSINEPWLKQNMSLSILVNKFNEINNILRNGIKRKTNQPATSDRELAELTAKHFATDYEG